MKVKRILEVLGALAVLISVTACTEGWTLPVHLGDTKAHVRETLGPPSSTLTPEGLRKLSPEAADDYERRSPGQTTDWFDSHGFAVVYFEDRVSQVTIQNYVTHDGWLEWSKPIVAGVRLRDNLAAVRRKLGEPVKTEIGSDPEPEPEPALVPLESNYYWKRGDYTVQIRFRNQAQRIDSDKGVVAPSGTISSVYVYR